MRSPSIPVFLALAVTLAACERAEDAGPPVAERTDSAGVEIITNRGPDRPLALTFTPRLTLGGKDEGPESFFRLGRGSVAIDRQGNIHVLDFEAKTVSIFDSVGKFLRTLGRPGDGPGELQFPSGVRVATDGVVSVFDFSKDGIVRWGPDGSVLPSVRITTKSPPQDIALTSEGTVSSWIDFTEEAKVERTVLQVDRNGSVEVLGGLDRPKPAILEFKGCGIMMRLPPLFSPQIAWATNGSRIAWVDSIPYEIAVRDSGGRSARVRRDVVPRETTPELARREVGDSMRVRASTIRCAIGPEEVASSLSFAPVMPTIRSLVVAPDGALWVQRMAPKTDPAVIDVFTANGDYRGTLPAGSPMPLAFFPNGDIAAMQKEAENDVERLVVYRISESPVARR